MRNFYSLLDREIKELFLVDVCKQTGWKKSRFYTRLGGRSLWTEMEMRTVTDIYEHYKSKYIVAYEN